MNWYLTALKKYAEFGGRARRSEFWFFTLFNYVILFALVFVDISIGSASAQTGFGILSGLYYLGVFIPTLAVTVRRLHDTDRSGWWILLGLVPLLNLVLLVFMFLDGTAGNNSYGPDPKGQQE